MQGLDENGDQNGRTAYSVRQMLSMSRAATDRIYGAAERLAVAANAKAARDVSD
jgi:hypothetical protein